MLDLLPSRERERDFLKPQASSLKPRAPQASAARLHADRNAGRDRDLRHGHLRHDSDPAIGGRGPADARGARLLSGFLGNAQTRAVASGRSVAVIIQPLKNNGNAAMDLYLAEVPPPYIGDSLSSSASVTGSICQPFDHVQQQQYSGRRPASRRFGSVQLSWTTLLSRLQIDRASHGCVSCHRTPCRFSDRSDEYQTPITGNSGVPFQVFRQPVKTYDTPGQMLDGAAIDLNFSGIDPTPSAMSPVGRGRSRSRSRPPARWT